MGDGEVEFLRKRARPRLFKRPQREHDAPRLLARQAAEHIALVVGGHALVYRAVRGAGVMPRGDELRAKPVRLGDEAFELERGVAYHAGVRRLAAEIALRKRAAHALFKRRAHVQHGQRYADELRRRDGVAQGGGVGVVHIQSVHLMPGALEQHRRHGGVHPAGKAEDDLAHFLPLASVYIISTDTSAGETPEMRPACPKLAGRIFFSFSRASILSPGTSS